VCAVLEQLLDHERNDQSATSVQARLLGGNSVCVMGDAAGLSLDDPGRWELAFTGLLVGGRHVYGLSTVTALSTRLVAELAQDGQLWRQVFNSDESWSPLEQVGPTDETGFRVTFWPRDMFGTDWDGQIIADRVETYVRRFNGVSVEVVDERTPDHRVLLACSV